jgi:UDP-GlcNAc:undecaprenyl-phosphate/decaprenyl-phosphate GlcNAc-1-phosphate transferase
MISTPSLVYTIFRALLLSLLAVLFTGWLSIHLARRIGLIDYPGSAPHKRHIHPTPLAGGIAIVIALLVCTFSLKTYLDRTVWASLLACIPIFVFGLWDDYRNISAPLKLLGQLIAAILLIWSGVYVQIFETPGFFFYGSGGIYLLLDWMITVFWVVGITNAFNFVDSMDGLAVGLGGMTAAFFVLLTLDSQQPLLTQHSAILLGICVGLYFYNSQPALLFLGDSGAQTLGVILAVLAIGYRPQVPSQASSWFVPIMLLGVPIFDTVLIVLSRLRRKRPISSGAHDHTYHRLSNVFQSSARAVLVMQMAAFVLGCLAFLGLNQPPLVANTIFTLALLASLGALIWLERYAVKNNS